MIECEKINNNTEKVEITAYLITNQKWLKHYLYHTGDQSLYNPMSTLSHKELIKKYDFLGVSPISMVPPSAVNVHS